MNKDFQTCLPSILALEALLRGSTRHPCVRDVDSSSQILLRGESVSLTSLWDLNTNTAVEVKLQSNPITSGVTVTHSYRLTSISDLLFFSFCTDRHTDTQTNWLNHTRTDAANNNTFFTQHSRDVGNEEIKLKKRWAKNPHCLLFNYCM